jgi:2-oxoacid:acceptor oxidoreductase gamma subunit (pyruvate/2-ketoisovalerate family)
MPELLTGAMHSFRALDAEMQFLMSEKVWEIRWHGRGGQGAVTAATLLARAAMYAGYKGTQAFPFFGAERRGAPIRAFTRISKAPILIHSQIYCPDVVVVLDSTLLAITNVLEGAEENAVLIVNTTKKPSELDIEARLRVFTVDATGIALKLGLVVAGQPVVNTPILGAFSKATSLVDMKNLGRAILEGWKGDVGKRNLKGAEEAFDEVRGTT